MKIFICILMATALCHATENNPTGKSSKTSEFTPVDRILRQVDTHSTPTKIEINIKEVFLGSPVIYSLLLLLSFSAVIIWTYISISLRSFGKIDPHHHRLLEQTLREKKYERALSLCGTHPNFLCQMISQGILFRKYGHEAILKSIQTEGKRLSASFWQKMSLLNDIAVVAPMLGLLGTVTGMFYAFYDLNRSLETLSTLFDGLGISVGTTIGGLGVAILSMVLYAFLKYRFLRRVNKLEQEATLLSRLIEEGYDL